MWLPVLRRNRPRRNALLHRGIWFADCEVGDRAKGDIVKTKEEQVHTARESGHRSDEATDLGIEHPTLDQKAIARLAYFYWEERGSQ